MVARGRTNHCHCPHCLRAANAAGCRKFCREQGPRWQHLRSEQVVPIAFAQASTEVASDLVVVGSTNRRALAAGSSSGSAHFVRTREEAVAWVRATLGPGDAVLYENDLPDHYR